MKMGAWLMVGTFVSGVLVLIGQPSGAILMLLGATLCFAPVMNLLDHLFDHVDYDDDEPEDEDDEDTGGSDRVPPDEPWWPSGVCAPDDLVGV